MEGFRGWCQHLTSSMGTALHLIDLTKRFGRKWALHSLSLQVEFGEVYGFLGPNGAGKTTAIQLTMGFLRPTRGSVELLGCTIFHSRAAHAQVGYVADAPVFFPGTAMEAVLLAARLNTSHSPVRENDLRARARELLLRFDLPADKGDARKFSRGQQQRLALAQALITRPRLLILDEPTSALDPPGVMLVHEALEDARREGAAVFFSSHQLREVEQLCDRAAFLRQGRLLQSGTIASLLEEGATACITLRGLSRDHPFVRDSRAVPVLGEQPGRGDMTCVMPVSEQQAFLERAWAAGAELVRVERVHRTLEELFHAGAPEETGHDG